MPPFDLAARPRRHLHLVVRAGLGCQGSRVIPTVGANGSPAFGQYKPTRAGSGYEPWALQVLELADGQIAN